VVAISAPVKAHLEEDFGISPSRTELIHNGVDMAGFSKVYTGKEKDDLKRSLGLGGGPVVGTMGRLNSVKGQRFLIEAVKYMSTENRDVQCIIVGSGPEEAALKNFARNLGAEGRIKFTGFVHDNRDLYLSCMDAFVMPSIKEGLGLALLEAMAAGRPCVASGIGGITDIITDGINGLLVPPANGVAIASAVSRLLDDRALGARLALAGRSFVAQNFSLDAMASGMAEFYRKVINEKK
jgi:glycosyltransferase involved in cell wall biosynthesis